jgi:hypothetical protein
VPTVDFLATAIARATFDTQATQNALAGLPAPLESTPPLSPLDTPALAGIEPAQQTLIAQATETAIAQGSVLPVPGIEPVAPTFTDTPKPTSTPSPTTTPTSTQRPIVYPTPLPPVDFGTIFTGIVGSGAAATTFIFLLAGALAFFGVAGGLLAWGFLRNSRNRYEVYKVEDESDSSLQTSAQVKRTPTGDAERRDWPSSLP